MRLWSIHPSYLDAKGLVALWREALLAQKVLAGKTKGYKNHPQLDRFKEHKDPLNAISCYLLGVYKEAETRGYSFDKKKILKINSAADKSISVKSGQLKYEFDHLSCKLKIRDKEKFVINLVVKRLQTHPLFYPVNGRLECWERVNKV
ncbi:MAG: hypothetical protein KBD53_06430 [Candidatus Omnitrophica bacterium]|nr:hypothetical protein [Candidatus Omnitrophota bacterium]